jgi:hypothetical protein
MPPTEKKEFEEKFEKKNGKWEAKKNGGWQTKGGTPFPTGPNGEIEPWADSLRIWMCEMNQWAEQVTKHLDEISEELSALKTAGSGIGGSNFGDTSPH